MFAKKASSSAQKQNMVIMLPLFCSSAFCNSADMLHHNSGQRDLLQSGSVGHEQWAIDQKASVRGGSAVIEASSYIQLDCGCSHNVPVYAPLLQTV